MPATLTSAAKNIVLVHGGFVDGSGWEGVYGSLRNAGLTVSVVQNPTISLADDVKAGRRTAPSARARTVAWATSPHRGCARPAVSPALLINVTYVFGLNCHPCPGLFGRRNLPLLSDRGGVRAKLPHARDSARRDTIDEQLKHGLPPECDLIAVHDIATLGEPPQEVGSQIGRVLEYALKAAHQGVWDEPLIRRPSGHPAQHKGIGQPAAEAWRIMAVVGGEVALHDRCRGAPARIRRLLGHGAASVNDQEDCGENAPKVPRPRTHRVLVKKGTPPCRLTDN
jgi:hypothetical protein